MALRDEIAHLKHTNDGKSCEIRSLDDSIHVRNCDNDALRDQIKNVERSIVKEVDEGRNLRVELCKVNDAIDKITADINVTRSCIKGREKDIDGLNANINRRICEIDDRNKDICAAECELAKLKDGLGKANHDQDHLKNRLDDEVDRNMRLRKENDDLIVSGHGLRENIKDLEAQCCHRDSQINVMKCEIDKLNKALHSSEECNCNLNEELTALSRHSDMLHHQNTVLNGELEEALANDEFVRKELDRRGKVSMLQQQNDDILRSSMHMLHESKQRSPCRSQMKTTVKTRCTGSPCRSPSRSPCGSPCRR